MYRPIITLSRKAGQSIMTNGSIQLRTPTEQEYHSFFRHYQSDPYLSMHPFIYSQEQVSRSYHYQYDLIRNDYRHYGIFLEQRMIGCFQLKRIDPLKRRCEFGIILQDQSVRGHGYGTEAVKAGMLIAKSQFCVRYYLGDTMSINEPMKKVFAKLGFTLIEEVPNAFRQQGISADRLIYQKDLGETDQ